MGYFGCFSILVAAMIVFNQVESVEVTINTKLGTIVGKSEQVEFMGEQKPVTRFLGVPYAKPPVGERRLKRPEPFGSFTESYNATYFRPHCMQSDNVNPSVKHFGMSEDCLHLNIFIPGSTVSTQIKYAVMVFIHGGGFIYSGAEIFSGDTLSSFNDVVVVTINYRLNTFGFLSNGTMSSGNMGLWDQKLAIQWVHDHISEYSGDEKNVTLFGNSAGAASVLYQALNPSNRGLFKRIIAQSGSVLAQWAQQYNPAEVYSEFITKMNCSSDLNNDILQCLQSLPAEVLVTNYFGPVVDKDFIKEDPFVVFSEEKLQSTSLLSLAEVDFLSGVTSKDGAGLIINSENSFKKIGVEISQGVPREIFENNWIPTMLLQLYGKEVPDALVKAILLQYTDWSSPNDPEAVRDKMVDFSSDSTFFVPAVSVAKTHQVLTKANTYLYVFDYKPPFDPQPIWLKGARHVMELPYVFAFPVAMNIAAGIPQEIPLSISADDMKLSNAMMKLWTNFAKTG